MDACITFSANTLALAYASTAPNQHASIISLPISDEESLSNQIKTLLKKAALTGQPHLRIILEKNDYQLTQVSKPNVPDSELKDAIAWSLLSGTEEPQYIVGIFSAPDDNTLFAVTTNKNQLQQYQYDCEDADTTVIDATIPELMLAEYFKFNYPTTALVIFASAIPNGILLSVFSEGIFYQQLEFHTTDCEAINLGLHQTQAKWHHLAETPQDLLLILDPTLPNSQKLHERLSQEWPCDFITQDTLPSHTKHLSTVQALALQAGLFNRGGTYAT